MSETMPEPMKTGEEHYPSLYIDGVEDMGKIPDSGTMTVKFQKASESTSKQKGGKKSHSCCIEVTEIVSVKGGKSEPKGEDSGDALDKLKAEVESEKEDADEGEEE